MLFYGQFCDYKAWSLQGMLIPVFDRWPKPFRWRIVCVSKLSQT